MPYKDVAKRRAFMAQYYRDNKEYLLRESKRYYSNNREDRKAYREANKERLAKQGKARHAANRKRRLKQMKTYYENNKERIAERVKVYRGNNKERIAEREKVYGKANKEKRRAQRLKRDYGLTIEIYNTLIDGQHFLCSICHSPDLSNGNPLHVDHCHTTGWVRGLLCQRCNSGLGHFADDPERLRQAIAYLEFHQRNGKLRVGHA